jgi:hypothetical protein
MATTKAKSANDINQGSVVTGVQDTGGFSKTTSEIPVQFTSGQYTTKFDDYGLRRKTVEIGDWDMNTAASATVAHGLSATAWKNIRSVEIIIRNDVGGTDAYYNDSHDEATTSSGSGGVEVNKIDSTNVTLNRASPGAFDSTSFEDTSYNRGWVTVWYV